MKTYFYRLRFQGPVHFGSSVMSLENTRERLSSDSLCSALINSFSVTGEADDAINALKQETPGFILSSLFPFGPSEQGTETVYALPCPLSAPPVKDEKIIADHAKDLKQIKYLMPSDFFSWIGETPLDSEEIMAVTERSKTLARPWDSIKEKGWWAEELRPRVAADRTCQTSSIWRASSLRFHKDAGLYGLITINDETWETRLSNAFSLLGELGIGGERTYGMGCFDFSGFMPLDELGLNITKSKCLRFVLLSNYFPCADERSELNNIFEAWDFTETRGYVVSGRMATTLKRKRIRMIVEGSVAKERVKGAVADVTPEGRDMVLTHNVYRSGLAFLMPFDSMPCGLQSPDDDGGLK